MSELETAALVVLLRVGRHSAPLYAELIEQHASARAVLEQELAHPDDGQTTLLPEHDLDDLIEQAAIDLAAWRARDINAISVLDPDYPINLHRVHDRPPLIFVAGHLEHGDHRSLAVVGTRNPSAEGVQRANEIADHLSAHGYTVTSGLASGIDTVAHQAALANGARTVAVIGTGLAHSYPSENAALQRSIAARGAVLSHFWPDTGPSRSNFPMRNGVMSGLTLGTVIVEASLTSGTRAQARLAHAHGRPVFLARTLLSQDWAQRLARRPATYVFDHPSEITLAVERLTPSGRLSA